jgi:hypothetical protein
MTALMTGILLDQCRAFEDDSFRHCIDDDDDDDDFDRVM